MKRKGAPLKPPTLALPGSSGATTRARATDDDVDDDLGLEDEEEATPERPATGETEPAAVVAADEEEAEIADRSETKDLIRQRAMRIAAEEEEPEPLDELAADALEATHEDGAARPSKKVRAVPGESGPPPKRAAAPPVSAPKSAPPPPEKPASLAKAIAAKALQVAAKPIASGKEHKAAPRKPAPPERHAAKKPATAKKSAAKKPAAKKPARKAAPAKKAKGKR
jgi:hypothetical protein